MANNIELFLHPLFSDASLIEYWRLEGNSNGAKSLYGGTDTNITYSAGNGKFGQGAGFNGSTSKIVFGNKVIPTGAFSIVAYLKSSQTAEGAICCNYNLASYPGWLLSIGKDAGDVVSFNYNTSAGANKEVKSTSDVTDGNFHLIIATYNAVDSKSRIYVDGVLEGTFSSTFTNDTQGATNLQLGLDPVNGFTPLNGALDDVAIFSKTLSADDVSSLWDYVVASLGNPLFFRGGLAVG